MFWYIYISGSTISIFPITIFYCVIMGIPYWLEITLLVGGLEHFLFSPIVGMMIQSDELIFFRGIGVPPTSLYIHNYWIFHQEFHVFPICSYIFPQIFPGLMLT